MKALIMVADGFEDSEFYYPYYRFLEAGFDVDVAAPVPGTVTGKHGYTFEAKLSLARVKGKAYDVLIIPGGKAPEAMRLIANAVALTRDMVEAGKVVGAICHGPQMLISAGVLEGRRATCWKGVRDDLVQAGAEYLDREVVVDSNLVTSRCPADLPAFSREVFKALGK